MNTLPLGTSDLHVSRVGLGCNNFGGRLDLAASRAVIDAAIEHGITLFDTADVYGMRGGSEDVIGQVLGARRKQVVLATKFGLPMDGSGQMQGASARYIVQALEASLARLRTDWIDLYQLHTPDPATPMEETLKALDALLRSGKVRYIGASNLPAWQVADAQWLARELGTARFISSQDEYSLLRRGAERELIPALRHYGAGLLPYFPLANGLLTGKYAPGQPAPAGSRFAGPSTSWLQGYMNERDISVAARLADFARSRGHTPVELAFSWLAAQPVVGSVIAGATSAGQVRQNVAAAQWVLSAADLEEIDRITAA